ncbi:MAG: hypothetical protein A2X64_00425 [Ignavibacteria bacterium GWF2_33_9]|nr:MAG: hypothetical protein A2X64_00425 [Ignavibacteria bacterium GWF2_33_9]
MFPNQSPYSYSFNNPLTFKDPSGLAPEKEKGGRNQIQSYKTEEEIMQEALAELNCQQLLNEWAHVLAKYKPGEPSEFGVQPKGTASSGKARLGIPTYTKINEGTDETKGGYTDYEVTIWTSFGPMTTPTRIWNSGIAEGRTVDDVINSHVNSIYDVQQADPGYFDDLYGGNTKVEIDAFDNIEANGKRGNLGKFNASTNTITLAGDMLTGDNSAGIYDSRESFSLVPSTFPKYQPYSIIAHEFAHAKFLDCVGADSYAFYHYYKDGAILEHYAVTMENRIRSFYGAPVKYNSYDSYYLFKYIFYPTWRNYFKNYLRD